MRFLVTILLVSSSIFSFSSADPSCKGCVNLDEYNFDKIVSRFKVVLVKFDQAYPYGEKHEIYTNFAEEVINTKDVVVAEVGVKDYGDNDNEELAKKYNVNLKSDFPALRLFTNGNTDNYKSFPQKNNKWTLDEIRKFVKSNTDIYIGLPGCLEVMDNLSREFIKATDKEKKCEEIEKLTQTFVENEKATATIYVKYMRKIIADGIPFITKETQRINKLLKESKLTEKKKKELSNRINILQSFSIKEDKDEL